ncbi:MAG: ATP-dependent zinc metalloprotease FtsH [Tissierellia bacterium]|nr:ATP-dependent zinc metalloprotease FtsH [Tissierellia bacterium]
MNIEGKKKLLLISTIILLLVVTAYTIVSYYKGEDYKEISYATFIEYAKDGQVSEIELKDSPKLTGKLSNKTAFVTDNPRAENFKEQMLLYDIKVIESENMGLIDRIIPLILMVGSIGMVVYLVKNGSKQAEREMENMANNIDVVNSMSQKVTFNDIAGNEEAKESLKELVDFIREPEKYSRYGARLPRGVMLYGPPGTGKTLLAKALASEAAVPFYAATGSDFVQVYAGLGASRIRELFKKAKKTGKSVIFIDEIDALGKARKGANSNMGSEEGDRTLNALLTEMSGFKENEGIIVLAATNRIDTLDEALLRPGRFDRQIEVGLPDINGRLAILKIHSRNKPLSKDVDLEKLARETVYFSGAKLENLMNESAMIAARNKDKLITMEHIEKAFLNVLVGEEKKDRSFISLRDKKITAYHEAGHALVAKKISPNNRVTRVSIIPSTRGMGGFSLNIPPDRIYKSKKDIIENIMIALGGRAAEEIIFGKDNITTGASSDLKKATEMVLAMIGSYGMDDELGLINYEVVANTNLSMDTSLIKRGEEILRHFYSQTKTVLLDNIEHLHALANQLIRKESLNEEEIEELVNGIQNITKCS